MTATTPGREPVQIVELRQPLCANTFGSAPCTASGSGDTKCYNTFGTCQDKDNYRISPAGHLTSDVRVENLGVVQTGLTRSADLFFVANLTIPTSPRGIVWHFGDTVAGVYLGFGAGNTVIFRAGDGGTGTPTNTAKISTSAAAIKGRSGLLCGEIDVSANSVSLWFFDTQLRTIESVGTATAAGSFGQWASAVSGAVGTKNGTVPTGELGTDFNGRIVDVNFYDSTSAPDMTAEFVQPLYFSRGNVGEQVIDGAPYIIPSLRSVSTAPTKINLMASNPDAQGLGTRALASLQFADHPHTDRVVDPYLSGRTFDPMARGSFWSKWKARNAHRTNTMVRVWEGYAGQALSAMDNRLYALDSVDGPDDSGSVRMQAKDILARVEERKSTAPQASPGELYIGIDDTDLSFEVAGAVVADYPSSGTIRIDDELMTYSNTSTTTNGVTFTISSRGTDNTVAAAHDAEAGVQECLRYSTEPVVDIVRDLMATWAGVDDGWLDYEAWDTEATDYLQAYQLSTVITSPVAVSKLLSELQQQVGFYLWWDERAGLVKLKAIRGVNSVPDTISAENHILPGLTITEKPRQRASQVWFYYDMRDYTAAVDDPQNYERTAIIADLNSETEEQYGEPSIRKVYSRWIQTQALAETTASKTITRYVTTPREIKFMVDAKDKDAVQVGENIAISHYLDVDQYGERNIARWTITSVDERMPGETLSVVAEDTTLYGFIYYILASGAADYPGAATAVAGAAYIGDADGLLSDGETCARIG